MPKFHVTLFSDGGCKPNPGPGGWATILKCGSRCKTLSGGCRRTTNNRMELRAVIEGFKALKQPGLSVQIVSDSRYVTESIARRWLDRWAAQQFRKAGGLRENADLWAELRELMVPHTVSTRWIRGHAGHRENEKCDELATAVRTGGTLSIDAGFEQGRAPASDGKLFWWAESSSLAQFAKSNADPTSPPAVCAAFRRRAWGSPYPSRLSSPDP